jgi:hypothetical protein
VAADDPQPKFLVCGSIISLAGPGCTVWGAGLMHREGAVSPTARYLAVRGPRTRARALTCGADCPAVYGDPALLLPRLYSPVITPSRSPGFVAHFSDRPRIDDAWAAAQGIRLIDIQQDIEAVIDQVASCDWVMSSCLHGLIVAHAYGVPALWVRLRDLPSGDGIKFADYYESLEASVTEPITVTLRERLDLNRLERLAWCPVRIDTMPLWASCPFQRDDT